MSCDPVPGLIKNNPMMTTGGLSSSEPLRIYKGSRRRLVPAFLFLLVVWVLPVPAQEKVPIGSFSRLMPGDTLPAGWESLRFKGIDTPTLYSLVSDQGITVLKAESRQGASGLMKRMTVNPEVYPVLKWRWKAGNLIEKGDVTSKEGDDYPARIYITFAWNPEGKPFLEKLRFKAAKAVYGEYPPDGAINYIWDGKAPEGTMVPNPYASSVAMIVVESGSAAIGTWVEERRNVVDDYRHFFGKEPPEISGIAVMTDTDNTGEAVTSWYGDIVFSKP